MTGATGPTGPAGTAGASARTVRTAGNLTLNSTNWADVDTALDLSIPCAVNDWVEVGVSALWNNEAVGGRLDAVSVVSGSPVNSWADDAAPNNAHDGVVSWGAAASVFTWAGGTIIKKIVAGDLSAGVCTIRLRYRTATASNKTLLGTATDPLVFFASVVSGTGPTGPTGPTGASSVTEDAVLAVGGFVHPGPLVAGRYYGPAPGTTPSGATMSRSICYLIPMWLPPCSIDRLAMNITSSVASTTLRMGIYQDNGAGVASALGVDGGTISAATNGLKEVTLSPAYSHPGGLLWLACQMTGGASNPGVTSQMYFSQIIGSLSSSAVDFLTNSGTAYFFSNTTTLPNPCTPTSDTFGLTPRMTFRAA